MEVWGDKINRTPEYGRTLPAARKRLACGGFGTRLDSRRFAAAGGRRAALSLKRPPKSGRWSAGRHRFARAIWVCLMSESSLPLIRRLAVCLAVSGFTAGFASGCASRWHLSFAEVEQARLRDRQLGRPERDTLLFYKDPWDPKSGQMQDVLESPLVKPLIADKHRCMLVEAFAPNQRYMTQYRVDSAPALVVVHPDGTYHARLGLLTAEQARNFLTGAVGSGSAIETNAQILPVPGYYWHGSYEKAAALAARQNRALLVVYKWWLSAESTELLSRLSRPRVRRQFGEMVHCLLDWDYVPNRAHVAPYGVSKVPSMIIIRADGTYHTLVGLPTVERIMRFSVGARSPGRPASTRRGFDTLPAIHWQYNYERAHSAAERQGANLFVFYHSVFADASNRSARRLDTPEAAALLAKTVCCRLDWVVVGNHETAAQFGVDEPPAYVVLRRDGTYHARSGSLTLDELSALLTAAERPGGHPHGAKP